MSQRGGFSAVLKRGLSEGSAIGILRYTQVKRYSEIGVRNQLFKRNHLWSRIASSWAAVDNLEPILHLGRVSERRKSDSECYFDGNYHRNNAGDGENPNDVS